jgi:hypothetical protein
MAQNRDQWRVHVNKALLTHSSLNLNEISDEIPVMKSSLVITFILLVARS